MQYTPKLTKKEIAENHKRFSERMSLYKELGLDFAGGRDLIIEKARPLEGKILEIGTGSGYMSLALAKAGYTFVSVDRDREALKTAAANLAHAGVIGNVKLHEMDGENLTFADGSFDTVVVVGLFHHLKDTTAMLSEINRVLGPRGKAVIADFNEKGMEIIDSVHRGEGRVHESHGSGREFVYAYFDSRGYETRSFMEKCHWLVVGKKGR